MKRTQLEAAIEHFDEQLLGVNVDFGAVKVTVGRDGPKNEEETTCGV